MPYQEADWRLHLQICDVMGVTGDYDRADGLVHLIGDWWPNRTKHFEIDANAFVPEQVMALRALLKVEFKDWRITAAIYSGLKSHGTEYISGVCIYAMRILVQRDVLHLVEWSSPRGA